VLLQSRERSRPITMPPPLRAQLDKSSTLGDGDLDRLPVRAFPGWLIAVTFACIALFVAGLVVYLRRPEPGSATSGSGSGSSQGSATPSDAAIAAKDSAGSAGSAGDATRGMLVVRKSDGSPLFYADPKPVTVAAYRQLFSNHQQGGGAADDPVVMVSYTEARSYAATRGGRLLTNDEFDAVSVAQGFSAAPSGLHEWVDSPDEKKKTVRQVGKAQFRPDAKHKDVTFRVARDP